MGSQEHQPRALLDALLANTPVGLAFLDAGFRYVRVNAALAAMNGLPLEAHLGRTVSEVLPLLAPAIEASFRRVLATGQPLDNVELRGQTAAAPGEERCWLQSFYPVRDEDGQVLGLGVTVVDITDRQRAEAERERSEQRLAVLARASEVLASSLDWETTLQNVVGLALPLLADFGFFDVVEPDGEVRRIARAYQDPAREALLAGTRWVPSQRTDINVCALSSGRSGFHPSIDDAWLADVATSPQHLALMRQLGFCSMITVPLLYGRRRLGALTLFYADSGRRHTQADLALAEELARRAAAAVENARLLREAREAIRARDEFLSIASHELRTPLTTVQAHAQLALRRLRSGESLDRERFTRALEAIEQQSQKLGSLISHLLDVSRIEAGRLALRREPTDLRELVEGAAAAARARHVRHRVRVRTEPLPLALVDPLRLEQVLANLLDNAARYSPEGASIHLGLRWPKREVVEISVRDHGVGIPPERRAHIFERFYRAHADSHSSGLGLGLHISREIVELHGGELRAEFPDDGGTRFVVRLPLVEAAWAARTPEAPASGRRSARGGQ